MATFDEVTSWTRDGDAWFTELPEDWMQGRGAFGGVVSAAGLRSMRTLIDPARTPRTVTTSFLGPVTTERARLRARVLRAGGSLTFAEARIEQGGSERAVVQATFGADRPSRILVEPPLREDLPDPEAFSDVPYLPGVTPQFTRHVQLRWTEGAPPFSGVDGAHLAGFGRFREPPARGPERLLGLLDLWPSPTLQQLSAPAPSSSVTATAHLLHADEVPPGGWCWFRYETMHSAAGYTSLLGRLYDPGGRLIAWTEQLAAVFG